MLLQFNNKKIIRQKVSGGLLNRHFTKDDMWMKISMRKCAVSSD